jgi:lipoprotein-releasing system permease protein
MKLAFKIAARYFSARKRRSFISIIANVAMLGVGVGTMAMIVVLSVFNGMEELNRTIFKTFDADFKISAREGRTFAPDAALLAKLSQVQGLSAVTEVLEDNALLRYGNQQMVVRLKGVDASFEKRTQMEQALLEGSLQLYGPNGTPFALVSEGVRNALLISLDDYLTPLELWYPRSDRRTLQLNTPEGFNQQLIRSAGTFFIESRYDDYVIAPVELVAELLQADAKRTALELQLSESVSPKEVRSRIQQLLPGTLQLHDRDELNADLLRAIRIEKLFVTVTLSFILLVVAVNIFFSLSMLVIEKKNDISMLLAMGATPSLIRTIFLAEGFIVALTGSTVGVLAGVGLCWLQETYGLVSMGMVSAIVDAYPVRLLWSDVWLTAGVIFIITFVVSIIPAQRSTRSSRLLTTH